MDDNNRLNENMSSQPQNLINGMESSLESIPTMLIDKENEVTLSATDTINTSFQEKTIEGLGPNAIEPLAQNVSVENVNEIQNDVNVMPVVDQTQIISQSTKSDSIIIDSVMPVNNDMSSEVLGKISSSLSNPNSKKSRDNKFLFIMLTIILVVVSVIVFLSLNRDKKDELTPNDKQTTPVVEYKDWDSSTSKIVINNNTTKLMCTLEEPADGMVNKITYTHVYEDDVYVQIVIEDEMIFTNETLQYYDYFVGAAEEEVEYQTEMYDNITIEVREKKSSVSLAYSFDLTASAENSKNMLESKDVSMEDMKLEMENMGFICE